MPFILLDGITAPASPLNQPLLASHSKYSLYLMISKRGCTASVDQDLDIQMIFGSDRGLAKSYLAERLISHSTVFSSWESVLLNEHWTRRRRCLVEVASRGHALTSKTKTNGINSKKQGPLQVESPESSIANHCRQCAQPHNLCKIVSRLLLLNRSPPNLETVAILTKNGLNKTQATSPTALGER